MTAGFLLAMLCAQAESWRFAVIGDTPYVDYERQALPGMLEAIADSGVAWLAHIGDFKRGDRLCDDAVFADRHRLFDSSRIPFVFIPGDNEWSDCNRLTNGGYDPLERLQKLRTLFWADNQSLGKRRILLQQQSAEWPEHARFRLGPVLFITLNVPGGNNNRGLAEKPSAEFLARNPQVLAWLRDGFALAREEKLRGIVILMQADPDFRLFRMNQPQPGYRELLDSLREETLAFPGEVMLVHGDTHYHRIDKPLRDLQGLEMANFTRLETYGYPFMGWAEVVIDDKAANLFRLYSHPWPPTQETRWR